MPTKISPPDYVCFSPISGNSFHEIWFSEIDVRYWAESGSNPREICIFKVWQIVLIKVLLPDG